MKVLYVAYRYDPQNPDLGSGTDYQFYNAIKNSGAEVAIFGPDTGRIFFLEKIFGFVHRKITKKKYAKYPITQSWDVARKLNAAVNAMQPDIVFSIYPPPLVSYRSQIPYVFRTDTTFLGMHPDWPIYSKLSLKMCVKQEKRVLEKASCVITHSEWSRKVLIEQYKVNPGKIRCFTNPASLPSVIIPPRINFQIEKRIEYPLRLLIVGRDWHRKGNSVAIEIARQLNESGCPAHLTICGMDGENQRYVNFVGSFKKGDPLQLQRYVNYYRQAHFLIHPAIFEPAGIVPSEAAAFGTPTITNDSGGLATTVKNGVSGIVLPKHSPPALYVQEIISLIRDPSRYYELCRTSRERYEKELNWDVAGVKLAKILQEVVDKRVA